MMTVKKGMMTAAVIAALGTGGVGISSVFAAGNASAPGMGMQNLIQALADKFGVSTSEVQAVFDAQRQEMEANREARAAEHLAQAVTNGTLTQEQADAITAHHAEMETFRESLKNMTNEERKAAFDAQREADKAWAEANNIPSDFLPHEGPGHRGPGDKHGKPPKNENIDTNNETAN